MSDDDVLVLFIIIIVVAAIGGFLYWIIDSNKEEVKGIGAKKILHLYLVEKEHNNTN